MQFFGQVNKLLYADKSKKEDYFEKNKPISIVSKKEDKNENTVSDEIIKRENTIISILINNPENFKLIEENMKVEDFKYDLNRKIIEVLYKEFEKEVPNMSAVLDKFDDTEIQNHLTAIMAEDYGIVDNKKAIEEILNKYERERLEERRNFLLKETSFEQDSEKKRKLGEELNNIMLKLAKIKNFGRKEGI